MNRNQTSQVGLNRLWFELHLISAQADLDIDHKLSQVKLNQARAAHWHWDHLISTYSSKDGVKVCM